MCDFCKTISGVDYKIVGKTTVEACPNCVTEKICSGENFLPEQKNNLDSEVSGCHGAIEIYPFHKCRPFILDQFEAKRFLAHQLMPNEYVKLLDHHSEREFDLHDDFYSNDGLAYQPVIEDQYIKELKQYASDYGDPAAKRYADAYEEDYEWFSEEL